MLGRLRVARIGDRADWQNGAHCGVRFRRLLTLGVGCALLAAPRQLLAFPPNEPPDSTTATVPANNEAMLLFSRVEQAIQQADWRLVLALRERLMGMGNELVIAPPGRTYYPIWRQATKLFERLPPEGRDLYRQTYEAEAAARLREIVPGGDLSALRDLFRTYAGLSIWPAIGAELTAQLLDQGQYGDAIETIQVLNAAQSQMPPERRMQLVAALGCLGHWQAAREHLDRLSATEAMQQPPWPERLAALRAWVAEASTSAGQAANGAANLSPALAAGLWWEALEPASDNGACEDDLGMAEAIALTRRLPLQTAVLEGDILVTRGRGAIWAFDALTLRPQWHVRELAWAVTPGERFDSSLVPSGMILGLGGQVEGLSADANALLSDALRHALSTGNELVFTIEATASGSSEEDDFGVARFGGMDYAPPPNELVARDLATGNVVWRRGSDPADALYGVSFQDVPIVVRDRLCVPLVRAGELHLCLLAPSDGATVAEVEVVGPPTYFTRTGGRCQLVSDESTVFVATGNGVVAALSSGDLTWKWATTYPSTLAARRSAGWWPPPQPSREVSIDRPLLTGELLVLAPADAASIFALERATGRQRWRIQRRTDVSLVGATNSGVLLAGNSLTHVDANDGATVLWRTVPLEISGRPAVGEDRIFVPTRDGVVTVDSHTGKILSEPGQGEIRDPNRCANTSPPAGGALSPELFSRRLPAANLVAAADAVFAISPNCLVKFPDIVAARKSCAELLAMDPGDERARYAEIWLELLSGDPAAALAKAEEFQPNDVALAAGREKVLTDIFVSLSDSLSDHTQALALLRRATRLAQCEDVSARLALLIGRLLEQGGHWAEAAQQYQELLAQCRHSMIPIAGDPQAAQAVWLQAVSRLRMAARQIAPEVRDQLWQAWLDSGSPELLQRLRLATEDLKWQEEIDRALLVSSLPLEIRARYATPDDPSLPHEKRRELHLARWELHVRLGLLAEAEADQRFWAEQMISAGQSDASQPAASQPGARASDALARRVRTIERAMAELAGAVAGPLDRELTGRYAWKLPNAELIMDASRPQAGPTVLVRHSEDQIIGVHNVVLGGQCKEILELSECDPYDPTQARIAAAWWAGGEDLDEENTRTFWRCATNGHMAAVAVQDGLFGLGLGCARGADKLWHRTLAEWGGIAAHPGEALAGGTAGVYVGWRQDRVALLDWADGSPRWERSLPGLRIDQLLSLGERLIIVGRDGDVVSVDANCGDDLRSLSPVGGAPRAVTTAGETLVVWTEDRVGGYDPATFVCRWLRPSRGVEDYKCVAGSNWVLYRDQGEAQWGLIDADTGDPVFAGRWGEFGGTLTAAAKDGGRLLIAAFSRKAASSDAAPMVHLAAFDAESGAQLWERDVPTLARVNQTQLQASADLIPVLVARSDYEYTETRNYNALALCVVDKESGAVTEPVSIMDDFRGTQGRCAAYLLATPSRIIVQANGTIAAYGPVSGRQ